MSSMHRNIRTLLFSTLYPSQLRPGFGIFVETRLRHLLASGEVDARVVAPVPWFPSTHPRFGQWATQAAIPATEVHNGINIDHPRYLLPPKVGMNIAPLMLAAGARASVSRLLKSGFDFDLIDAHYFYPDGVAAALLSAWFKKPFIVTARGTDLNVISRYPVPQRWIRWAISRASFSVAVSSALAEQLLALGADRERVVTLRNGVDLQRFVPYDRTEARARLALPEGPLLLSVGNLVQLKGHHIAIEALQELQGCRLAIVGAGAEAAALQTLAARLGLADRVIFAGARPQEELRYWYSAADLLVLCSSREGWANVLLEAMACGTPVLATSIPGTREVLTDPVAGRLIESRNAAALAIGVRDLLATPPGREAVRAFAEGFDWEATTQGQLDLFRKMLPSAGQTGEQHA